MNELFTNAYKCGFSRGRKGEMNINFLHRKKEDEIEISFCNTGAALPEDFDVYRIESMGLRIVVMLTEQLAGAIKVGRKDGTRFTIRFPKPE